MHRRSFLHYTSAGVTAALVGCTPSITRYSAPPASPTLPGMLFATGIENSYPRIAGGTRVDQMDTSGHSTRWREDFALARGIGVNALRYGPAWYRTNPAPGRYDWSSADEQMCWLRDSGMTVIADLCHFGTPDWIGGFQDPSLPAHFADYASAFARRYPWVRHFTPINEMFVAANFSAMLGWWNECASDHVSFARALRHLSLAHEMAIDRIIAERPDAIIVQVESVEGFQPADLSAGAIAHARFWNDARFAALDLTLGRVPAASVRELLADAGMTTADYAYLRTARARGRRWLGVDYYVTSEHMVGADGNKVAAKRRLGLASLATTYHARYGLPLFITETSRVASHALAWLDEQWAETARLAASGVRVHGFTWFPLVDTTDWGHALRVVRGDVDPIGLYRLDRSPHPVAGAYAALIAQVSDRRFGTSPLAAHARARSG
ncbi:MAG TPA: family 1 glycosylhydrolase [Gemmatimonas sp.]|nr:family 1 glycosylhydrolase [Gemmatimonas sp.]